MELAQYDWLMVEVPIPGMEEAKIEFPRPLERAEKMTKILTFLKWRF